MDPRSSNLARGYTPRASQMAINALQIGLN
jgi:hypothetical protein